MHRSIDGSLFYRRDIKRARGRTVPNPSLRIRTIIGTYLYIIMVYYSFIDVGDIRISGI